MADQPLGNSITLVLLNGSADIDGYPLPRQKPRTVSAGYIDYFIQSWVGCDIKIESTTCDPEDMVVWIKSCATFHQLLTDEFTTATRVLVLDTTHNNALSVANYAYRRQTGESTQHLAVNLDVKGNAGVCCLYKVNGSIPPHHPLDFLPEHKHMFWVGTEGTSEAASSMAELTVHARRVTVYINAARYTDLEVADIVTKMGIEQVVVTSDRRFSSLSKRLNCGVSKLAPVTTDNCCCPLSEGDVAEAAVYRNIYLQKYRAFHFPANTGLPLTKFMCKMSRELLPAGSSENYCSMSDKNSRVYAMVSGFEEERLMSFWGFAVIDYNGRCHTMFPRLDACRLTFVYAMPYLK